MTTQTQIKPKQKNYISLKTTIIVCQFALFLFTFYTFYTFYTVQSVNPNISPTLENSNMYEAAILTSNIHSNIASTLDELDITKDDINTIKKMDLTPLGTIISKDFYEDKVKASKDALIYKKAYYYNLDLLKKYVKKFLYLSKLHDKKYNIPYEITLAQGILESNTGLSKLARKYNNHFGLKPRNASTCSNKVWTKVPSESSKTWFMNFEKVDGAFREHSKRLKKDRYLSCYECNTNYNNRIDILNCWANELYKNGYAEDPKYSNKLIKIIKELELSDF